MSLKYKHALSRRTLLQGTGVSLALPFLDAMVPSSAVAASSDGPKLIINYLPNGAYTKTEQWVPSATGSNYTLAGLLAPLAPYKDDVSVISGLYNRGGEAEADGNGDHARAAASYLTGQRVNKQTGAAGKSIDQMIADKVGVATKIKSLELSMEDGYFEDSGYPSITKHLSWRDALTPRSPMVDPQRAFELLFGAVGIANQTAATTLSRRSILDLVAGDARSLRSKLCASDQQKIDQYLTAVRELEVRLNKSASATCEQPPSFKAPASTSYSDRIRNYMDLMALAIECDATRVISFSFGQELTNTDFGQEMGVSGSWHLLSHWQAGPPEQALDYLKIVKWMVDHFTYLVNLLRTRKSSDGKTLLDQSLVTFGAGISEPNYHVDSDLPLLLAGRGGGYQPGHHLRFGNKEPLADFWLAIATLMGCPEITSLGLYGTKALDLRKR